MQRPAGEAGVAAPLQLPPQVGASLAHSARILLGRAGVTIALGAGVVLALLSLCCGIGVHFHQELFASHLRVGRSESHEPTTRALAHPIYRLLLLHNARNSSMNS